MWISVSIIWGLFFAAFLAATVLPFSSEAALSGALMSDVPVYWCLAAATAGNSLGSVTTFLLGRLGRLSRLERYCRVTPEDIASARKRIGGYCGAAAFLCFLPVLGDGFAVALGFMRYPVWRFTVLMTLGKFLRYCLWIYIHRQFQ